jgi:DNA-binding NtrC family response regulator
MIEVRKVLVARASREERASLRRILSGVDWLLCYASTFPRVKAVLRSSSFGVVICPAQFGDGHCWQDVLNEVQQLPIPPPLIVADRLADEALWAEALNLGCYDVLMTPFDAKEVLRVVAMAWDFWRRELERSAAGAKPPESYLQSSRKTRAAGTD